MIAEKEGAKLPSHNRIKTFLGHDLTYVICFVYLCVCVLEIPFPPVAPTPGHLPILH